ncbi:hypothetical protein KOI40_10325 [Aestuariicella sp. G3-2]|uniref:hypothetical protein n=1 Tax=Pseudomaricurvus albidus TaxID=2842452 RepID=UPI001C0C3D85|nr:hypothetical protein [Aestuariicella albida]MBU3070218.1 hypothetical protein [Aestuariicella albida]
MSKEIQLTYHEIDFLVPAQRFKIQFSYVSQKALPFIREFILRLVHLAPMNKTQLANFFGLSPLEIDEAVKDLVQREELTLNANGRLCLTSKAQDYFVGIGDVPQLSMVQDSGATLAFELASFSCLGNEKHSGSWHNAVRLEVENSNRASSAKRVEVHFQRQFNKILDQGFLPKSVYSEGQERPSVYTVNAVDKLRDIPLRLETVFKLDWQGQSVVREDFEQLNNSEIVHSLMTNEMADLSRTENTVAILRAMQTVGDSQSLQVFDSKTNLLTPEYLDDLHRLEENQGESRMSFLGPVYMRDSWGKVLKALESRLKTLRQKKKSHTAPKAFSWIVPSDPFWGKSGRLRACISDFLMKAEVGDRKLYIPRLYLPVSSTDDFFAVKQWRSELGDYSKFANGLLEGFLDGSVEVMLWEGELAVVIYHCVKSELPVTMPLGFVTTDSSSVNTIGEVVNGYLKGISSYKTPNDCGPLSGMQGLRRQSDGR